MSGSPSGFPPTPRPYRRTLADRRGADPSMVMRAVCQGVAGGVLGFLAAVAARAPTWALVVLPIAAWAVSALLAVAVSELASRGVLAFVAPSGASCPYQPGFSRQEALAAAGDVDGALASYDAHVAGSPDDVEAHLAAAELCARHGRPARAAERLLAARRIPGIPAARELYATSRIVDLLLGPLGDRGRAVVELRRLADRHPGTPEARHAEQAIARLRAELFANAG